MEEPMPMRRATTASWIVLASLSGLPTWAAAAPPVSLGTAVRHALDHNPQIQAAQEQIEAAQAQLDQAIGHLLPRIDLSATALRSDGALAAFGSKLNQRSATVGDFGLLESGAGIGAAIAGTGAPNAAYAPDALNRPGFYNDWGTKVQVVVPIYNGGRIWTGKGQAEAMVEAARDQELRTRQEIAAQLVQAYLGAVTATAYVEVAQQGRKATEEYVAIARNLLKGGVIVESDLLNAQVHQAEMESRILEAQNQQQQATDYVRMLGNYVDAIELTLSGDPVLPIPEGDETALIEMALNQRPDLLAMKAQSRAAEGQIDQAEAGHRPNLNLIAMSEWHKNKPGLANQASAVLAQFDLNLYAGGSVKAQTLAAEADYRRITSLIGQMEEGIRVQVRQARRNLGAAAARMEVAHRALSQAAQATQLTRNRYREGLTTMAEVLQSEAGLDKARADLVRARHDQQLAALDLMLATGQMKFEDLIRQNGGQ